MKKWFTLFCVVAFGLAVVPAWAGPHVAELPLGGARDDARLSDMKPCESGGADSLCGELDFGGKTWQSTLSFKDGMLSSILLSGPVDNAYMDAAFQGFTESPYVVYNVISEPMCFDFIQKSRDGLGVERVGTDFSNFLATLQKSGHSSASYFYTERAIYDAAVKSPTGPAEPCGPQVVGGLPEGVACRLGIAPAGITVTAMSWADMQARMADKTFFTH